MLNTVNYKSQELNTSNNKIAIMGDIHANYYCFSKALLDIKKRQIDTILFLGDYITDGFENNEVLNTIKKYEHVILGNRELSIINYDGVSWNNLIQFKNMLFTYNEISKENIQYLKSLPKYKIITLNNKKLCLSHGTPFDSSEIVLSNSFEIFDKLIENFDCDIYLFAHMHIAYYTTYKNRIFINPGSIFLPCDTPTSKYGILDLNTNVYEQVSLDYDFDKLKNYYLNNKYFFQNQEWYNILIHTNETGFDYICAFIDFVKQKAIAEDITITYAIPNNLWHSAFLEFMEINKLHIY